MHLASPTSPRSIAVPVALTLVSVLALAACGSSSTPGPSQAVVIQPPPVSSPTAAATAAESAQPSESAEPSEPTAVPTAIDPCTLVTSDEASAFTGATYGAGKESETPGHLKQCIYGSQTPDVFEVDVLQAPDVATAQAAAAAAEAEAKSKAGAKLTIDDISGIGDKAVFAHGGNGNPIGVAGMYVLTGPTFYAITDVAVGKDTPSEADFATLATTILGRLPAQ